MSLTRPPERRVHVVGAGGKRSLLSAFASAVRAPKQALALATEKYREVKAEIAQVARSRGRMIRAWKDIIGEEAWKARPQGPRIARPTGSQIRMMDGDVMVYYDDGSLRHVFGRSAAKAARRRVR